MTGTRSPKYPNFSLRAAVKHIEKVFQADRRNVIDRAVAAKHIGYSGLSGPADKTLATLLQYGLLERVGKGEVRVSKLALEILHPDAPGERARALSVAAFSPTVFKAVKERFPEGVSPEALRSYLVREDFLDRAIGPITKAYSETAAFLEQEGANDSGVPAAALAGESVSFDEEDEDMEAIAQSAPAAPSPASMTKAQALARTPGVGPVSMAQMMNLPPEGWTQAVFPLAEGPVYLNFPQNLTADGYAELKEYLEIFLRRAERQKRQEAAQSDDPHDVG
jgi:hypothetical protein